MTKHHDDDEPVSGGLRSLEQAECLERLEGSTFGRLGVVVDNYPMIFPVNYVLDGNLVTFRTNVGEKFNAARYSNVTFEVDDVDSIRRAGWSVMVLGACRVVDMSDPEEASRMQALGVTPLASEDKTTWVQIVPDRISGREIAPTAQTVGFDPRGYL